MNKITKIIIGVLGALVIVLSVSVAVGYGSYVSKSTKVNELERRLSVLKGDVQGKEALETKVEELQKAVDFSNQEKKYMIPAMTLAMDLSKAYVNSNLDKVEAMLADKMLAIKESKKIYLVKDGDLKDKTLLFDTTQNLSLSYTLLNDYEKIDETTYFVELKQYFLDAKGNKYSSVGYLDLKVVEQNGDLKVNSAKVSFKNE